MTLSTRAKETFRGLLRWLYLTRVGGEAAGCAAGGGGLSGRPLQEGWVRTVLSGVNAGFR
jgi:hypothetical protein